MADGTLAASDPLVMERMDAALELAQAEGEVMEVLRAVMTGWLREVTAEVLSTSVLADTAAEQLVGEWQPGAQTADALVASVLPPDADGVMRLLGRLEAALTSKLAPVLRAAHARAYGKTVGGQAAEQVTAAAVTGAVSRARALADVAFEAVRGVVADGTRQGYSLTAVTKGVRAALTLGGKDPRQVMRAAQAAFDEADADRTLTALRQAERRDDAWTVAKDAALARRTRAQTDYAAAQLAALSHPGPITDQTLRDVAVAEAQAVLNSARLAGDDDVDQVWLTVLDDRTRPDHRAADGQTVRKGEPFLVGGEQLAYPGDPSASPGQRINCRCSVRLVPRTPDPSTTDPNRPTRRSA